MLLLVGLWITCGLPIDTEQARIRAALEKALPLLVRGMAGHRENRTCFACHNQALPALALTTAQRHGIAAADFDLTGQLNFVATFLEGHRENYLKGRGQGGQADTAGYALFMLGLGRWKPDATTASVTEYLLQFHREHDHWRATSTRPPSEASDFTTTYLALLALKTFGTPEQKERIARRFDTVRGWLSRTQTKDTEDRVFRLLGLKEADAGTTAIQNAATDLLQTQREDGGWSQLDSLDSDAYATGSALVALHQAGGLRTLDPIYRRGLRFLLANQEEDGSWYVASRSKPFQTYFETGFPHGNDQFISAAASGWAATALALAVKKAVPATGR